MTPKGWHSLKKHCPGAEPVAARNGQYWSITCPKCGKRINYYNSLAEARFDWNIQMECLRRMKEEK